MQAVKNRSGCNCCGEGAPACGLTITVWRCTNGVLAEGATVVAKSGATVVDTKLTNSSGVAVLDVGAAGTYSFEISKAGYTTKTVAAAFRSCGATITSQRLDPNSSWTCNCNNQPVYGMTCPDVDVELHPATLFLSDGVGTVTLQINGTSTIWVGCATRTVPGQTGTGGVGNCTGAASVATTIQYELYCSGGEWVLDLKHGTCSIGARQYAIANGTCPSPSPLNTATGVNTFATPVLNSCSPLSITWSPAFPGNTLENDIWGASPTFEVSA